MSALLYNTLAAARNALYYRIYAIEEEKYIRRRRNHTLLHSILISFDVDVGASREAFDAHRREHARRFLSPPRSLFLLLFRFFFLPVVTLIVAITTATATTFAIAIVVVKVVKVVVFFSGFWR